MRVSSESKKFNNVLHVSIDQTLNISTVMRSTWLIQNTLSGLSD